MRKIQFLRFKKLLCGLEENKQVMTSFLNEIHFDNNQSLKKSSFKLSPRNRCLFTNETSSLFSKFRLSRQQFNRLANKGLLIGVKKAV